MYDEPFTTHVCHITQFGYFALMLAAKESWTDIVSLLLEAGAKVDLQNEVM